jgi:hypothetical protein
VLLAVAAGLAAGSTAAHHSWSAEYDLARSTYLNGTVSRVLLRNPHSALELNVEAEDGRRERWTVEWASPQRLRERGVTQETLRSGDSVFVTGNPHRDPKVRSVRATSVRDGEGQEIGSPAARAR